MGQINSGNRYHVNSDGDIFKVNEDGSFTSLGNAERETKTIDSQRLAHLESKLISIGEFEIFGNTALSADDIKFVAMYSQNSDALLIATGYDDGDTFSILVKRFEGGATFLEDAVLNGGQYEDNFKVKLALAQCRRKFSDDEILRKLAKDRNGVISQTAKANPNYTEKSGGCLGVIAILIISTLTIYLI